MCAARPIEPLRDSRIGDWEGAPRLPILVGARQDSSQGLAVAGGHHPTAPCLLDQAGACTRRADGEDRPPRPEILVELDRYVKRVLETLEGDVEVDGRRGHGCDRLGIEDPTGGVELIGEESSEHAPRPFGGRTQDAQACPRARDRPGRAQILQSLGHGPEGASSVERARIIEDEDVGPARRQIAEVLRIVSVRDPVRARANTDPGEGLIEERWDLLVGRDDGGSAGDQPALQGGIAPARQEAGG